MTAADAAATAACAGEVTAKRCGGDPLHADHASHDAAGHDGRHRPRPPLERNAIGGGEAEGQHDGSVGASEDHSGTGEPEEPCHYRGGGEVTHENAASGTGEESRAPPAPLRQFLRGKGRQRHSDD
ncbi:hypothetical protein [Cereibacter sphaeroides]|uniref:hypothetical protein n=1 Tax=Cereibacter sphaeroides TaxID=1063 RepID=UPI001F1C0FC4|nr:hypothetical protein [Cereibacter sphaeroides]